MTRAEIDFAIDLAEQEGWNPGLHDGEWFYRTDPRGFLIGILNDQPIGCISAVSYERRFGFIGLYIVKADYRGCGYGIRLWQAAMQLLAGQNIGLDGVVAEEANYIRSGFRTAYRNQRFQGTHARLTPKPWLEISDLRRVPFKTVLNYDRQCFPAARTTFLQDWLNLADSVGLAYLEHQELKGWGVIRECRRGYKIGPLFADNRTIAEQIYLNLVSHIPAASLVYLDVPGPNAGALALVQKYQMQPIFETVRMYSREEPDIDMARIYGVTTFELG